MHVEECKALAKGLTGPLPTKKHSVAYWYRYLAPRSKAKSAPVPRCCIMYISGATLLAIAVGKRTIPACTALDTAHLTGHELMSFNSAGVNGTV